MDKKNAILKTLAKRLALLSFPIILTTLIAGRVKTESPIPQDLKETKILGRALHFIKRNYVDPSQLDGERLLRKSLRELERAIAPLHVNISGKTLEVTLGDHATKIAIDHPMSFDYLVPTFRQLLGFLDQYYTGRIKDSEREYLALSGIVEGLDPHSNFLPPKVYNEFRIGTKGNFGGLGIVIGIREGQLTVISPIEGTPAYEVGIKANDHIIQIGEEAATNLSLTEAVERLRGPVGSVITLVIQRESSAMPIHVTLKRALIQIKAVGSTLLPGGKVGLVKVKSFQEDTSAELVTHIKSLIAQSGKLKGIILDLRNDPGGLLDQAVAVSDLFLKEGLIVKTVGASEFKVETESAGPGEPFENIPLMVLVNEGSASAAEIVAGALQQNDRSCVMGTRSFGKGSVQTVFDLKDGSALKLTIAKYLTAHDYEVQSVGITPDINLIPVTIGAKQMDLFENVKRREDDLHESLDDEEHKSPPLPPSRYQLRFLSQEKDPEAEENAAKVVLDQDPPVRLAQELILSHEGALHCSDFKEKEINGLLERWKGEEETKMEQALKKVGVNWGKPSSSEKKADKPQAIVSVRLTDDQGNLKKKILPGETGKLIVTVENNGAAPFYRLAAVTKSDDPIFANLEFPFGLVNPGEKKEWSVPLKIQDMTSQRSEPITLVFHELNDRTPPDKEVDIAIDEPPHPRFSYRYEVIDIAGKGTQGNGNGQPEKGETLGIKVTVRNVGPVESPKPFINLRKGDDADDETVLIEKGRIELAPLAPGQESSGLLLLHVQATKKFDMELSIVDSKMGEELSDHLSWDGAHWLPPPGSAQTPPQITLSELVFKTASNTYPIKGICSDDQKVKHLLIFVNGDKALLVPNLSSEKNLPFDTSIKLKKGFNIIQVIAQDDEELSAQKQWVVWRKK